MLQEQEESYSPFLKKCIFLIHESRKGKAESQAKLTF